jgi:hypothetical protein
VSLYPWRPACGCLIDEVDGEPTLLEWCQRHDGCRLVVLNATYPPVTTTGVEAVTGSPGGMGPNPGHVTTERRYGPRREITIQQVPSGELRVGDTIEFMGSWHRISDTSERNSWGHPIARVVEGWGITLEPNAVFKVDR